MIDLNSVFAPNENCPVREIGDGVVILAPDGGLTHSLEGLGVFIWRQLDGKKKLAEVLAVILNSYDVDEDTARKDLLDFVDKLQDAELITTA